jgi:hypothetical protein
VQATNDDATISKLYLLLLFIPLLTILAAFVLNFVHSVCSLFRNLLK